MATAFDSADKLPRKLSDQVVEDSDGNEAPNEKSGTRSDARDMYRMGKNQQLQRNFRFMSILGFTCILMSTWETTLNVGAFGLVNGGTAGMIWSYIFTFFGFMFVIASMAEMASMAPTSGGQYHWVSEFSPKSAQKFLSYMTGWICVLGWQTGITGTAFGVANQIQSLLVINDSSYVFERWHGTLIVIAISAIAICFNTYLAKKLPLIEGVVLFLHICGFFAILIPLWVLAPRTPAKAVFTEFNDDGGWGNNGLACLVGMLGPVIAFIGPDSAVHMSEEIQDASRILPRAMMWTAVLNGSLGFIMLITFCFTAGDLNMILSNPDVQPFVLVFLNGTQSNAGATVMTSIIIVLTVCGCITNVATASRQMWSFARDDGLPFSKVLSFVRPGWDIPLNSVIVSFVITILLSLINLGSTVAFNAILSLGTASLISSYIISITCVRIKRWRGEPFPHSRWSLGKYGGVVNDVSILYLIVVFVFSFFPMTKVVQLGTMNWNVVIYGFVVIFAGVWYVFVGKGVYRGPVVLVRKED